jgi:hypothetical protein
MSSRRFEPFKIELVQNASGEFESRLLRSVKVGAHSHIGTRKTYGSQGLD